MALGAAALVGINTADGNYTVHPNSLTDSISNIDTEPGNVNSVLGQWVYRTDASSSDTSTGIYWGAKHCTTCNGPCDYSVYTNVGPLKALYNQPHMVVNFKWLAC